MDKIEKYLNEGMGSFRRMASLEADLAKKYKSGVRQGIGKTPDLIYKQLTKVPEFKKLSMDRQGEIAVKVMDMIQGRG